MEIFEASLLNITVLATLLFWGAWGIFDKLALRYAAPLAVMIAINCLVPFLPPVVYYLLVENNLLANITAEVVFWSFLAGLSYFVAMLLYLWALNESEASFVLGITSSYPVVLQFLSSATLDEPLVPIRIAGSLLVFAGVVAIGFSRADMELELKAASSRPLWMAIIVTTLLWGIWGIFDKKAVNLSGPLEVMFCQVLWDFLFTLVLILLVCWALTVQSEPFQSKFKLKFRSLFSLLDDEVSFKGFWSQFKSKRMWIPAALSSVCLYAGAATYLIALSRATASYVVVITGCYPLIMYFFALLLLKERFNRVRLLGIVLITVGGILTQTTQKL